MAHVVNVALRSTGKASATVESLLERLRFEVVNPKGADRSTVGRALNELAAIDATDANKADADVRVTELRKAAGTISGRTLAAGYTALADELEATTKANTATDRAAALFADLASNARSLHALIDTAVGTDAPYAMQVDKHATAGRQRWIALSADYGAATKRTIVLDSPAPTASAKAAEYRRLSDETFDPILRSGYLQLARNLDTPDPTKGPT